MRKPARFVFVVLLAHGLLLSAGSLSASGPIGIYGIVEKVVFEPSNANETNAARVQVWGAFAYAELDGFGVTTTSPARRGYLYFRMDPLIARTPERALADAWAKTILTEWADLKTVAGTGQAVGFGRWGYLGGFGDFDPSVGTSRILEMYPGRGEVTDMRVRPAAEPPSNPAVYQTGTGVVKLMEQGSHTAIVKALREALGGR